ncbi:MAG: hypothetical protein IKY97_06330 [Mailhella sp.]|nr:hypothetical protein [Mailhella sp.]
MMTLTGPKEKSARRWPMWLGAGLVGVVAFGLSFGSLALEHTAQKAFLGVAAKLPIASHTMPELSLFPPALKLDKCVLRGPQGDIALQDIRVSLKPFDQAVQVQGNAAGGHFDICLLPEDWGRGAWKVRWDVTDADILALLRPWGVPDAPLAVRGGRVALSGHFAVPSSKALSQPWMGTGRVELSLRGGAVSHSLPVLNVSDFTGLEGRMVADWNKTRLSLREAVLRQKDMALEVRGGLGLKPRQWKKSELRLEAELKGAASLLNQGLLPQRIRSQMEKGSVLLRLSGTPEKPEVEF